MPPCSAETDAASLPSVPPGNRFSLSRPPLFAATIEAYLNSGAVPDDFLGPLNQQLAAYYSRVPVRRLVSVIWAIAALTAASGLVVLVRMYETHPRHDRTPVPDDVDLES